MTKNLFLQNTNRHKLFSLCLHKFSPIHLCGFVFLFVLIGVSAPLGAEAAVLFLESSQGEYSLGKTFIVQIKLDTEGEEINAVEIHLAYPKEILEMVDFSDGGSVLELWVKKPEIEKQGDVSFIGGVPNGFNGKGLIGKIALRAIRETAQNGTQSHAKIEFLDSSQILLNDGKGTSAKLATKGAVFQILAQEAEISKNEWQEELKEDNTPPESFEIEVSKDPSMFDGKYFIAFSTIDKETGIDHCEIKEGNGNWQEAISPYLLEDQSLKSIIKVKAVDKAGNERIETLYPEGRSFPYWIIILILIGMVVIGWFIKKYTDTHKYEHR